MPATTTTRLFVYGTLKPGFGNYAQIEHLVRSAQAASTQGVLVDLGAYPAMIPGHGRVKGILLEVDEAALVIADRIEGYRGDREHNLFKRKKKIIRLESGGEVKAWVYEFADPERITGYPYATVEFVDDLPVYEWPVRNGIQ